MPRFVQIISGTWEQPIETEDGSGDFQIQNILYALGEDGSVWKFVGFGWRPLPMIQA